MRDDGHGEPSRGAAGQRQAYAVNGNRAFGKTIRDELPGHGYFEAKVGTHIRSFPYDARTVYVAGDKMAG